MKFAEKVRINIYIPREIKEQSYELASRLGLSFSGLISIALNEFIKQDKIKDLPAMYKELLESEALQYKEKEEKK